MNSDTDTLLNSETAADAVREAWVKPEIASFEPVSATAGTGNLAGEGTNNVS
jgi:hypothetical protein